MCLFLQLPGHEEEEHVCASLISSDFVLVICFLPREQTKFPTSWPFTCLFFPSRSASAHLTSSRWTRWLGPSARLQPGGGCAWLRYAWLRFASRSVIRSLDRQAGRQAGGFDLQSVRRSAHRHQSCVHFAAQSTRLQLLQLALPLKTLKRLLLRPPTYDIIAGISLSIPTYLLPSSCQPKSLVCSQTPWFVFLSACVSVCLSVCLYVCMSARQLWSRQLWPRRPLLRQPLSRCSRLS